MPETDEDLKPFLLRLSPGEKVALKKLAKLHRRSLNGEIRAILAAEVERTALVEQKAEHKPRRTSTPKCLRIIPLHIECQDVGLRVFYRRASVKGLPLGSVNVGYVAGDVANGPIRKGEIVQVIVEGVQITHVQTDLMGSIKE